jgi:hypothetical protein
MASIINIMNTAPPDDTSNRKRLIRDSLVEFLATTVFVYAGTLSALSTVSGCDTFGYSLARVKIALILNLTFDVPSLSYPLLRPRVARSLVRVVPRMLHESCPLPCKLFEDPKCLVVL